MGLFDNLFLDKNTPMAINNGEEHSVVTQSPPQTQQSSVSTKKAEQAISNAETAIGKADTVAELFAPEKPKASQNDIQVVPIDDIQFSPEIAVIQSEKTSSEVSFDIGGDMSFDIGGDIGLPAIEEVVSASPTTGTNTSIESTQVTSSGITAETSKTNGVSGTGDITQVSSDTGTIASPDNSIKIETSSPSINMGTENPTDSALFSLLNESVTEPAIQEVEAQEITPEQEPINIEMNDSMQSLLSNDESSPQVYESEPINTTIPSVEPIIIKETIQENNQIIMSDTTQNITPIDTHSGITFHSIEEMPGLDHASHSFSMTESSSNTHGNAESKFNAKIKGFIEELRNLEAEDQKDRDEKLNQAALFRSHAKSLREEAEVRARALEEEAEDLVKQADSIAADKAHINSVISNFREKFTVV